MHYNFFIHGVHGKHCTEKIATLLKKELHVEDLSFSPDNTQIKFSSSLEITTKELNALFANNGGYTISDKPSIALDDQEPTSYKPIYLIFGYLLAINILIALPNFQVQTFMINFMAGFFLVFSFFKMLDIKGFADGYASYDIVAQKFYYYGYIYPIIELSFGISYILFGKSLYLNLAVFIVMLISSIGVIKVKLSKQKFKCACVGTFLKVPLGNITIIEDLLMMAMALAMIVQTVYFNF